MRDFVTVVSGVPRSGTSLLMQVLAAGGIPLLSDDHRPADDDNPRGYFEYEPVKATARDASWWPQAMGRAVKVVHSLLPSLPEQGDLRVLLVERDLAEVLRSQQTMLERAGRPPDSAEAPTLARVFEAQLEEARLWAVGRPRTAILRVSHRGLLEEPERVARRIDEFLGGGLDVGAMAGAVDPSLYRAHS